MIDQSSGYPGMAQVSDVQPQPTDLLEQLLSMQQANQPNPQDFISQQLAGDVVNMRDRMFQPQPFPMGGSPSGNPMPTIHSSGARGMESINAAGGRHSPYLDLMDILMPKFGK